MGRKKRIAILTGGGDCPGLNAVIRAVAKKAIIENNAEIIGVKDGFAGLVDNSIRNLDYSDVSGILSEGGTILGASNIANPYNYPVKKDGGIIFKDLSKTVIRNIEKMQVECLVCIGGDGTLSISKKLFDQGVPVIGVPKTIDNDVRGTDISFGFNSAYTIATEGIDRLQTTAQSHHRVIILEVMGRRAGWLALYSGVAGGADVILIPEIPYDIGAVLEVLKRRNKQGKRYSIIVIAEGAKPKGGKAVFRKVDNDGSDAARFGGVGFALAENITKSTDLDTRTVVMGHLMRGGSPTPFDRVLGTRLGTKAVDLINDQKFGYMSGVRGTCCVGVDLYTVTKGSRLVPENHTIIKQAISVGTSMGV